MRDKIELLGLIVNKPGTKIRLAGKDLVCDWHTTKNITKLRNFVEMVQFF